jgi:hypothetical protein
MRNTDGATSVLALDAVMWRLIITIEASLPNRVHSPDKAEERPNSVNEQSGLLEGGEVAAFGRLVPVPDVGEAFPGSPNWPARSRGPPVSRLVSTTLP